MVEAYIGGAYKLRKSAALVIGLEYSIKNEQKREKETKREIHFKKIAGIAYQIAGELKKSWIYLKLI